MTNPSFRLITNRKETEGWLWDYIINQTIKYHNLVGLEAEKFKLKPNQDWLKATADRLLPDCDINEFPSLNLGLPPEEKTNYNRYSHPRADKKQKRK